MMGVRSIGIHVFFTSLAMSAHLLAGVAAQAQDALRIGYFDIPPHVVEMEGGKPKGAAISYFEEYLSPHLGLPVEWDSEITAPTRLMNQLKNGEKDAMIFLGKTAERTEYLYYPEPYLIIPETLAFRSDYRINQITDVGELHGLTIGFLVGGRIPGALRDDKIKYDLIAGKRLFERNVEKLLLGRIDAVYAPLSTALADIIDKMEVGDRVKLVPIEFLAPVQIYTVFSKKTVNQDVIVRYNMALAAAKLEHVYIDYIGTYLSGPGSN